MFGTHHAGGCGGWDPGMRVIVCMCMCVGGVCVCV